MSEIKDNLSKGNYIELVMIEDGNSFDISDKIFFRLMTDIKTSGYNCFQKHYKEYVYRNLFYENNEKNQIKIHKKSLMNNVDIKHKTMKMLIFNKEKQPYNVFPASRMLHSICYVSRVTFKINNRVYINFEKRKYEGNSDVAFNKVYINYNHDDNVDLENIISAIEKSLLLIAS